MIQARRLTLMIGLAVVGTGACTDPPGGIVTQNNEVEPDTTLHGDPCDAEWKCGANSPVMEVSTTETETGRRRFHELSLHGVPNTAGFRTESNPAQINVYNEEHELYEPYDLAIEDSRIVARNGVHKKEGTQLEGAIIPILDELNRGYELKIERVRLMRFPFPIPSEDPPLPPDPQDRPNTLEAYTLAWRPRGAGQFGNLCSNPPFHLALASATATPSCSAGLSVLPRRWEPSWQMQDDLQMTPPPPAPPWAFSELLGLEAFEAVVFGEDRINAKTKTMSLLPDPDWFNIGCAGHTVAKLHLTRNTIASQPDIDPVANHKRRQATLKLLVGDYCGNGQTFTVPGVPLQWKGDSDEARNAYFDDVEIGKIEARWTSEGAACLTASRLVEDEDPSVREHYPDVARAQQDIIAECQQWSPVPRTLPECHPDDPAQLNPDEVGGVLSVARVTANVVRPKHCVDFDGLAVNTRFGALGDAFAANGIPVSLQAFHPGSTGDLVGEASIQGLQTASSFGSGHVIRTNEINLQFDLTRLDLPARAVRFDFLDLGGIENLSVNGGSMKVVDELTRLPGRIDGVNVFITFTRVAGGMKGTVLLTASAVAPRIRRLTVGGHVLWIDNVCAWR